MKKVKHVDTIAIIIVFLILCVVTAARIITKEIITDKLNVSGSFTEFILHDLNDTVITEDVKDRLTAYTTSAMPCNEKTNEVVTDFDELLVAIPHTYSNMNMAACYAAHIKNFSDSCAERNIPFIYVMGAPKDSVDVRLGLLEVNDRDDIERNNFFVEFLQNEGVQVINSPDVLAENNVNDYDHTNHWAPRSALYVAKAMVEQMNLNGFNYDSSCYAEENCRDYFADKENWIQAIQLTYGYTYSWPIPNVTEQSLFSLDLNGNTRYGTYDEVFLGVPEAFNNLCYYGFSVIQNESTYHIHNENSAHNQGKKVLLMGDSFSWPVVGCICADTEYVDFFHYYDFNDAEILDYIDKTKPDMVIILTVNI